MRQCVKSNTGAKYNNMTQYAKINEILFHHILCPVLKSTGEV